MHGVEHEYVTELSPVSAGNGVGGGEKEMMVGDPQSGNAQEETDFPTPPVSDVLYSTCIHNFKSNMYL